MSDATTPTPLADALQTLKDAPLTRDAELGAVASDSGGIGVAGRVSTSLGQGWSLNAQGQWQHKTGWTIAAVARWKGK